MKKANKTIIVTSPSRLHLGFYGMNNDYGYSFGSIGLAINAFHTVISAKKSVSNKFNITGKNLSLAKKFVKKYISDDKFEINMLSKPNNHIGLGSGTQASLCLVRALSLFSDAKLSQEQLIEISNRGRRSGIGIGAFYNGGFIIDGCKKDNEFPHILYNVKFPRKWHVILINDKSIKGTSGLTEEKFFKASLDYYNHKKLSNELTNILLRGLFPAILYNDFDNFSKCLHEFQKNTSKFYFKNQKKFFLSDDIDKVMKYVLKSGYPGIGQSSWGPISYIFMRSKNEAKDLIKSMENKFKLYNNLSYHVVGANNSGHSIKIIEPKE